MINNRIKELIEVISNGNKRAFSILVGVSPTVIENVVGTRQGKPGYDLLEKIAYSIENINMNWIFTGEGSMLLDEVKSEGSQPVQSKPDESLLRDMFQSLQEEKKEKEKKIEKLTEELRLMERKVGKLEAELEHAAALGSRTAESASIRKPSSQSRASAHSASAHSNE